MAPVSDKSVQMNIWVGLKERTRFARACGRAGISMREAVRTFMEDFSDKHLGKGKS